MYEKLKQAILDRMYTVTEAMNLLNVFLQTGQITAEQYKELFEIAEDDHQKEWQEYKEKVDKMWEKFTETGEEEPEEPEEPDGTKEHPIPATNNMQYYEGKYYTYNTEFKSSSNILTIILGFEELYRTIQNG